MHQPERLPAVCRLLRDFATQRGLSNAEISRRIERAFGIVRSRAAVSQVMNGGVPSRRAPVLGLTSRPKTDPPLAFLIASVLEVPTESLQKAIEEDLVQASSRTERSISLPEPAEASMGTGELLDRADRLLSQIRRALGATAGTPNRENALHSADALGKTLQDLRASLGLRERA